ncbi:MAG: UDP-N-acetylmuramoyl-tripeptide--D-alanyl-D-alanine ligase [Steroidobacteraceae bacterium]|jgi:UDP-N-acetylmuramoyl-tripeptide--D-alanyl-D-alanine ligase
MIRTLAQFAAACHGRLIGDDREFHEIAIDTRKLQSGNLFAALQGAQIDGHSFVPAAAAGGAAGAIVLRPSAAPLPQIVVSNVEMALAQAAQAARAQFRGPVIGIAGSNGKTTVKEMLAAILSQRGPCLATRGNLNNHLGVPMTLLRLDASHRSAVIEMGANRRGDVEQLVQIARPDIGLITNAGAEHLEGFGSLEGAARAEGEMVSGLPASAVAVINADDAYAALWRASTRARVCSFGLRAEADFRAEALQFEAGELGFSSRFRLRHGDAQVAVTLALAGRHNVQNALAAAAAAVSAGASLEQVAVGLAAMHAVRGRLQFRRTHHGAWLIDDTYNANPSSARAALEVLGELPGRRWLALGDMAELGEYAQASHREIGELARSQGVERLYSVGALAALAAERFGAGGAHYRDTVELARALDEDLRADVRLLIKGSRVNRLERVVDALVSIPDARQAG